jgi:hypothetical protein
MLLTEPAEERHENVFGTAGAHVLVVQPDSHRAELLRPFTRLLDTINHLTDPQVGLIARRISIEIARSDDLTPLAAEALGLELLSLAARQFTPTRARQDSREPARCAPPWLAAFASLHDDFADARTGRRERLRPHLDIACRHRMRADVAVNPKLARAVLGGRQDAAIPFETHERAAVRHGVRPLAVVDDAKPDVPADLRPGRGVGGML